MRSWLFRGKLEKPEVLPRTLTGAHALQQFSTLSYSLCWMCIQQNSGMWLALTFISWVSFMGGRQESSSFSFMATVWDVKPVLPKACTLCTLWSRSLLFLIIPFSKRSCTPIGSVFSLKFFLQIIYGFIAGSGSLWVEVLGTPAYFKGFASWWEPALCLWFICWNSQNSPMRWACARQPLSR